MCFQSNTSIKAYKMASVHDRDNPCEIKSYFGESNTVPPQFQNQGRNRQNGQQPPPNQKAKHIVTEHLQSHLELRQSSGPPIIGFVRSKAMSADIAFVEPQPQQFLVILIQQLPVLKQLKVLLDLSSLQTVSAVSTVLLLPFERALNL